MTEEKTLSTRSGLVRFACFAAGLLIFYCMLDDYAVLEVAREQVLRGSPSQAIPVTAFYVGSYVVCAIALAAAHCNRSRSVRIGSAIVTALLVGGFLAFKQLNGEGFSNHEARLLWSESSFWAEAVDTYRATFLYPTFFAGLALTLLIWLPESHLPRVPTWLLLVTAAISIAGSARIVSYTQGRIHAFPVPYRIVLLVEYSRTHQSLYYGRREAPYFLPDSPGMADHIVFVMDESVRGDLLSINGAPFETTPFLEQLGDRLFNYGVIPSTANNSASSNLLLQSGIQPHELPDTTFRSLRAPNVFAYMKAAGYAVYLIDAQNRSSKPQNFMSAYDLRQLDGYERIRDDRPATAPEYDIDFEVIDRLDDITASHEKSFTYVLKMGAHFAYEARYPESERHFEPTLEPGENLGSTPEKTLNSYLNALRWGVDTFVRKLLPRFDLSKRSVLIVYTADHGQSLREVLDETGRFEAIPHGKPEAPPFQQAMVPLFLIASGDAAQKVLEARYDPALRNRVSGFEIFSTLLRMAGYTSAEVRERYGPSIFDVDADRTHRYFFSGNHFGVEGAGYRDQRIGSQCHRNEYRVEVTSDGFPAPTPSVPCPAGLASDPDAS